MRYEDRWPSVLQAALGDGVHVIAEGLNGRTTAFDDHLADADRNGARAAADAARQPTRRSTWSSSCSAPTT